MFITWLSKYGTEMDLIISLFFRSNCSKATFRSPSATWNINTTKHIFFCIFYSPTDFSYCFSMEQYFKQDKLSNNDILYARLAHFKCITSSDNNFAMFLNELVISFYTLGCKNQVVTRTTVHSIRTSKLLTCNTETLCSQTT